MCKSQLKKVVTKEHRSTSQSKSKISVVLWKFFLLIYSLEHLRQQQLKVDHLQLIQSKKDFQILQHAYEVIGLKLRYNNYYVFCTKGLNSSKAVIFI